MKRIIICTAFLILFSGQNYVYACSCGGTPSPCQAYAGASAVFIGHISKVEPEKPKEEDITYTEQTAYVHVEKAFKGVDQGSELVLHQPSHNCAPKFRPKQKYLLYAHYDSKEKTWEVLGCGRSTSIEYAGDDLLYLQGLPESATKTRISGEVTHYEDTPEKGFSHIKSIAGAKLKIIGTDKSYEVYTDQNGVYEIYGLPPGKYAIEPEIPFGLKIRFPMPFGPVDYSERKLLTVELKPKSCAGSDFILSSDTVISGKVFSTNGEVLSRVCLDLMPAEGPADASFRVFDCTEKDGRYEIDEIPPGKYLIVINKDGKISGDEPFSTVYYPGVFEKDRATVITIRAGEKLENYYIHIPLQLPTSIIQGVLLYSDGRPVAREFIDFKAEGEEKGTERDASTVTDSEGRFSFKVLQGTVGMLRGYMSLYFGKYSECHHANKLLMEKGGGTIEVESSPIRIEANTGFRDVKLVLPFSFCPKKEEK